MNKQKYLFIDRDGTLIVEPEDKQIDTYEKFALLPDVISTLLTLKRAGYHLVMVTNQNGIGRPDFPQAAFDGPQALLMQILMSQGIEFEAVLVCPHLPEDECDCRKPKVGLVLDYIKRSDIDRQRSYMIGDRVTDLELAQNMGIQGLQYTEDMQWSHIMNAILDVDRTAHIERKTKETFIDVQVNLDQSTPLMIDTGIGFYDQR